MHPEYPFPTTFITTNTEQRGEEGLQWLKRLPSILAACERRWSLAIGPPFPALSYNYAAPATLPDGTPLVIKVCYPGPELITETEALRVYDGAGAAQLFDFDLDWGVLLLERLRPGTMLSTVDDDRKAISIAASIMRQLQHPAPTAHCFPAVEDWAKGMGRLRARFGGGAGPFPERLLDWAERLFAELLPTQATPVVLHGDLHHYNILSADRQPWLAIDPKGVVGEPAYEPGALIRNPVPQILHAHNLPRLLKRRIEQLAEELDLDRRRIYGWSVAQAVLSAWWTFEDTGGNLDKEFYSFLAFTETLAQLYPA